MNLPGLHKSTVAAILIMLLAGGCTFYHTLYFANTVEGKEYLDGFRVGVRVFVCKDQVVSDTTADSSAFNVSVQVVDTVPVKDIQEWSQNAEEIARRSDLFKERVEASFLTDSLVLYQYPDKIQPIVMTPDPGNLSPRRHNYLTYQFGAAPIDMGTAQVRAVLYITHPESDAADSVVWRLYRIDKFEKGVKAGRVPVWGYE